MDSAPAIRSESVEHVSSNLIKRASLLTRLLLRHGDRELSRTEAGLLITLMDGDRRITDLAETEALAQPSVTKLVDRLQNRGLVEKRRSDQDGRVVLVSLLPGGTELIASTRARNQELMREALADLDDGEIETLVAATDSLAKLVTSLQARPVDR